MRVGSVLSVLNYRTRIKELFELYFYRKLNEDEFRALMLVLHHANYILENFEIGFSDPVVFIKKYEALVAKYIFPIMARALFLRKSGELLKTEAWKAATKNIVEFDTGYQGFNAPKNSSFRKDKQSSESFINNPLIFAQALKDIFRDDIDKFINEVKMYCLEVY